MKLNQNCQLNRKEIIMSKFYYEGYQAFMYNKSLNDSPYDEGFAYDEWLDGYMEAMENYDGWYDCNCGQPSCWMSC